MGDPKKTKKHYETPKKPHDRARLEEERGLVKQYGLKNKRELWKIATTLRKKRENARKLLALPLEERLKREHQLVGSLASLGLLTEKSTLDDVLTLTVESLLERRLQTMALRKGLANTVTQSRQFVTHGHIAVNGKKVDAPGYLVKVDDEKSIAYYGKPMDIKPKQVKEEKEKGAKKEFEEALPEEEKKDAVKEEKGKGAEEKEEATANEKKAAEGKEKKQAPKPQEKKEEGKKGKGKEEKKEKPKEAKEKKEEVKGSGK